MKIDVIEKGRMSDGEMGFVFGGTVGCEKNACGAAQNYSIVACMSKTTCAPHDLYCGFTGCSKQLHDYDGTCGGTKSYTCSGFVVGDIPVSGTAVMTVTTAADAAKAADMVKCCG